MKGRLKRFSAAAGQAMLEIGDRIAGFCQNCEQDISDGLIAGTGRQAGARMYRVKTSDGREHRVIEGVTQTVLSQVEIDRRIKRRKEQEAEEAEYRGTTEFTAEEHCETPNTESSTEYEALAEEAEEFL